MRRAIWLLTPVLAALALSACGGDKAPTPGDDGPAGAPPAAPVEPTATPVTSFLNLKPKAPAEPITGSDATLGGTPNRRAAAFVSEQIKAAGLSQTGLEVFVLPISGTHDELLVVDMDAAAGAVYPTDPLPLLKALLTVQNLEIANVTRIAINYRGTDKDGPYVFTLTLPLSTAAQLTSGAISQDQALVDTQLEMKRPAR